LEDLSKSGRDSKNYSGFSDRCLD